MPDQDATAVNLNIDVHANLDKIKKGLDDVFENFPKDVESLNVNFSEMKELMIAAVKLAQNMLGMYGAILDKAVLMHRSNKDDLKVQDEVYKTLLKTHDMLIDMSKMKSLKLFPEAYNEISSYLNQITGLKKEIEKLTDGTAEFKKKLEELGLDGHVERLKKFLTVGGQIGFWAGMFREATNQASKWRDENYALYGSMLKISQQVRTVQADAHVLQAEAEAAMGALMEAAVAKDSLVELGTAVADFTAGTKAGVAETARFAKTVQVMGFSNDTTRKTMDMLRISVLAMGLTGREVSVILDSLAKNAQLIKSRMGDEAGFKKAATGMSLMAGAAKQAGMDISDFANIMQQVMEDPTQYAVLLGNAMMEMDPTKQMQAMGKNAQQYLDMAKKMGPMGEMIVKKMTGLSQKQLLGLAETEKRYEATLDKAAKASGKLKSQLTDDDIKKVSEAFNKNEEQARRLEDPMYALSQLWAELKNAMATTLVPLVWFISLLTDILHRFNNLGPVVRYAVAAIFWLIGALILLRAVGLNLFPMFIGLLKHLGFLGTGFTKLINKIPGVSKIGAKISEYFKGLTKNTDVKPAAGAGLKSFGERLRDFFKPFEQIKWGSILKVAFIIGIMVIALGALAYVAKDAGWENLLAASVGIIAMAAAMWILSKVSDSIANAAPKMIIAGLAMLILAGAMLVVAIAMKTMQGVDWKTMGIMLITLAAMGIILGVLAYALGPIIPLVLLVAVALVIVAGAMWIAGQAAKLFAEALMIMEPIITKALIAIIAIVKIVGETIVAVFQAIPPIIRAVGGVISAIGGVISAIGEVIVNIIKAIADGFTQFTDNIIKLGSMGPSLITVAGSLGTLAVAIGDLSIALFLLSWDNITKFGSLIEKIAWVSTLSGGLSSVAASLKLLVSAIKGGDLIANMRSVTIAVSNYATGIEAASNRAVLALGRLMGMASLAKIFDVSDIVKASTVVTVKSDLDDKKKETIDRAAQTAMLEEIKKALVALNLTVKDMAPNGAGMIDKVEGIRKLAETWLPEIAEKDNGLAASTNQWNLGGA